jgi:hypothetical protein
VAKNTSRRRLGKARRFSIRHWCETKGLLLPSASYETAQDAYPYIYMQSRRRYISSLLVFVLDEHIPCVHHLRSVLKGYIDQTIVSTDID